jgi:hypothetical protein
LSAGGVTGPDRSLGPVGETIVSPTGPAGGQDRHPRKRRWLTWRWSLVIELLLLTMATVATLTLTVLSPSKGGPSVSFTPAVLGAPPPGSVVLAKEDGPLAVALAVKPQGSRLLLVATVLGQDGPGVSGLTSSFRVTTEDGQTLRASGTACSPGCYATAVATKAQPITATVTLSGNGQPGRPVQFDMPRQWPPRPGTALVRKTEAAYRRLRTLVTHERLASSPSNAVTTTYWAVAPNELHYKIRGGIESIIIGNKRWDRQRGKHWTRQAQTPLRSIEPFWTPQIASASLLGSASFRGRPTWVLSFATPQVPAWFTIWVDKKSLRTLQLRMTASAHFMHHIYGPFNSPISIEPPR